MALTLDDALTKGVQVHKSGNLKDAERIYAAILKSNPMHPDANHNYGVLALTLNNTKKALLFFEKAIEINPRIEEFWIGYIHALREEKQFAKAKQVSNIAEKQGLKKKLFLSKLKNVQSLLTENNNIPNPTQKIINNLLGYYRDGHFVPCEEMSRNIIKEFPFNVIAWKVLGAILASTGRWSEAENINRRVVSLSPIDPEAYFNLGLNYQKLSNLKQAEENYRLSIELRPNHARSYSHLGIISRNLGKFDEAELLFKKAIDLEPKLPEPYDNLGNLFNQLGRLDEAVLVYKKAISLNPKNSFSYNNLSVTLKNLGKLDAAEASLKKALALDPDQADVYNNLGLVLLEMGRLDAAESNCKKALVLEPHHPPIFNTLGIIYRKKGEFGEAKTFIKKALKINPDSPEGLLNLSVILGLENNFTEQEEILRKVLTLNSSGEALRAHIYLAINKFLRNEFKISKKHLQSSIKIHDIKGTKFRPDQIYHDYLSLILNWHEKKSTENSEIDQQNRLYVIGESHCLANHHLKVGYSGTNYFCEARLIPGAKQWHLGNSVQNEYKKQFENCLSAIPKKSIILITIGEIDCRLDGGIIRFHKKNGNVTLQKIISSTIENYLTFVDRANAHCHHKIIIQGVPSPNVKIKNYEREDINQLTGVIRAFNESLRLETEKLGFQFLDVYKLTDRGDGLSSGMWHIDEHHLSPEGVLEAWKNYLT